MSLDQFARSVVEVFLGKPDPRSLSLDEAALIDVREQEKLEPTRAQRGINVADPE